jgi:hypothetical protein
MAQTQLQVIWEKREPGFELGPAVQLARELPTELCCTQTFLIVFLTFIFAITVASYSSLLIFKLFVVLQTCILNTHWVKVHK